MIFLNKNFSFLNKNKMKNKSAQELYSDYKELQNKLTLLDNKISERVVFLCAKYPEATITTISGVDIKANTLNNFDDIIKSYPVERRIMFIENIEEWLKNQNKYKQLSLFDNIK
jgi:hypothetical protein